jgi:hypothetical protein
MRTFEEKKNSPQKDIQKSEKIQARLERGQSDDQFEKEADLIAEQVVRQRVPETGDESNTNNSGRKGMAPASSSVSTGRDATVPNLRTIRFSSGIPHVQLKNTAPAGDLVSMEENAEAPTEEKLASLEGRGLALPPAVQSEMESAMGTEFSGVRIHEDSQAAKMSRSIGAKAFTHQQDIYFNQGEYDTSSQSGKELLAHELVHTVQQQEIGPRIQRTDDPPVLTSPLFAFPEFDMVLSTDLVIGRSKDNSVGARGEFLRSLNHALGLLYPEMKDKLLRDETFYSRHTKKTVEKFQIEHGLHPDGAVGKQTLLMLDAFHFKESKKGIEHQAAIRGKVVFQDDSNWSNLTADGSFLHLIQGQRHYIVRADEIAFRTPITPVEQDVVGTTAVGRGGTRVVVTENGRGFLIDGGFGNQVTYAIYESQLQNLLAGLGVEQITSMVITHPHGDHITALEQLIETHSIRAENLIIGGQFQFEPRLQERLRNLANREATRLLGYHRFDFVRQFQGARTGEYSLIAAINQGRLRISFFASEGAINNLRQSVENGTMKAADVDAASLMTKIETIGSEFKMVVLGDLRGADYLELERSMETIRPGSFARLFRNVTSLSGMQHHLGRVNSIHDVNGIMRILEVTVGRLGKVSVIAQTKGNSSQEVFARALAHLGVEVYWTGMPGEGNLSGQIVAQAGGNIRTVGTVGSIQPNNAERAMAERIATLNQLKTGMDVIVRDSPKLMEDAAFEEYRRAVEEASREINLLYRERGQLTIKRLERKTESEIQQIQFSEEELEMNRGEIMRSRRVDEIMESNVELRETTNFLINTIGRAEEISQELELMARTGRSNRLVSLIHAASPQYAQSILRSNPNITATRFYRLLEQQAELVQMSQSMGGARGPKSRVGAGLLAILVFAHDVVMPVIQAASQWNTRETNDAWNIVLWWYEKGVMPTLVGSRDGENITDQAEISSGLADGSLDGFTMTGISDDNWQRFRIWISANVVNFNDYNKYFLGDPVRVYSRQGDFVTTSNWSLKMPSYNGSFSIQEEENATFTEIMDTTAEEMTRNTDIELDQLFQMSQPRENSGNEIPTISASLPPSTSSTPTGLTRWGDIMLGLQPLRRLTFRVDADRTAYSYYKQEREIPNDQWWLNGTNIEFFEVRRPEVLRQWGTVPSGYRLVMGANYNTYAQLVSEKMFQYSIKPPVRMPSKYFDGAFYSWDQDHFTKEQKKAYEQHRANSLVAAMNQTGLSRTMGFEIHFPGVGTNWHGLALVKADAVLETSGS